MISITIVNEFADLAQSLGSNTPRIKILHLRAAQFLNKKDVQAARDLISKELPDANFIICANWLHIYTFRTY